MFRKNHTIVDFERLLTIFSFQAKTFSPEILTGCGFPHIPHFDPDKLNVKHPANRWQYSHLWMIFTGRGMNSGTYFCGRFKIWA
jgi:hypothetical protein